MKSKLFSKLAALHGINIFNHSEKIEYSSPPKRIEPQESHSYHKLYHMSTQYFQDLVVQDKYIKTIKKLLDEYSFEVEKWDLIQTHHEAEIEKQTGKAVISSSSIDNLNATLLLLTNKVFGNNSKDANRIRTISGKIHSFFNKIRNKEVEIINDL